MEVESVVEKDEFACCICYRLFSIQSNLQRHINRVHFKQRNNNFSCEICDFKARDNYQLKLHQSTHTDLRNHQCDKCSSSFARLSDLKRHKQRCDGFSNKCDKCGKVFKNQRTQNDHVLWDEKCGRLTDIRPSAEEYTMDQLVRVKAKEDKDVVGFRSSKMFDETLFERSKRKVRCGVCLGCTRLDCGSCTTCKKVGAVKNQRCQRKKCFHPVYYYTCKKLKHQRSQDKASQEQPSEEQEKVPQEAETQDLETLLFTTDLVDLGCEIGCEIDCDIDTDIIVMNENVVSKRLPQL